MAKSFQDLDIQREALGHGSPSCSCVNRHRAAKNHFEARAYTAKLRQGAQVEDTDSHPERGLDRSLFLRFAGRFEVTQHARDRLLGRAIARLTKAPRDDGEIKSPYSDESFAKSVVSDIHLLSPSLI